MFKLSLASLAATLIVLAFILGCTRFSRAQATYGWLIRILPDGSVSPPTAPVRRVDRVYYLLEDLEAWGSDGIIVEASSVVLNGNGRRLRGGGTRGTRGVTVTGSNVEVVNLVVESFQQGILVANAGGVEVLNTTVSQCSEGVSVVNSTGVRVIGNLLVDNVVGVNVLFSDSVYIAENLVKRGTWGIYIMNSSRVSLARNNVSNSSWGLMLLYSGGAKLTGNEFWGCGTYVRGSYYNKVTGNTVNGKPLVYLEGVTGGEVREAGQVVVVRCRDVRISNLTISRASVGILLYESNSSIVDGCNLSYNNWGIMLHSSFNNSLLGNWVERNSVGMYLYESGDNIVAANVLLGNWLGLWLACSAKNTVHSNCFIANKMQASAGCGENRWVGAEGGNYWSEGPDVDLDGDGFADEVYRIGVGNIDRRPLTACPLKSIHALPSPSCALTLLSETAEVHVGEYFNVAIRAESPLPPKAVRFEIRGAERRETESFAWDRSSGPWDAVRKTVRLNVQTSGNATIEAYLKDAAGRQTSCTTTVSVIELKREKQAEEAKPKTSIDWLKLLAALTVACLAVALAMMRKRQVKANPAKYG